MTGKEIKRIRAEIPRFRNGVACNLTAEQKRLHRELDCREMINSCLCYGSNFLESRYSEPYIQNLGRERVIEIYNEQKIDFDKAIVLHNVYEDVEGVTYNSIKWEDEIADIDDNISPFPYASIQWSSVKELNELAIIFSKLDECQREAIQAYLVYSGEEHYSISQLVNICLQADNINYCRYSFEGLEYNQDCSPELKMGYTMAEENGIYIQLQKQGIIDYFDFEKYGESFGYDYELLSNGYFIPNYDIDLDCYSKEEIQEKMNEILNEKLKEQEVSEIEI